MTAPKVCPFCGAYLDAGEKCDCNHNKKSSSSDEEEPDKEKSWHLQMPAGP